LHCDMALLVQADFDGELSAADAARVELHRGQCAICRQTYDDLARLRAEMAAAGMRLQASDAFRARLRAALPQEPRESAVRTRRAWLGGAGAALVAAGVVGAM